MRYPVEVLLAGVSMCSRDEIERKIITARAFGVRHMPTLGQALVLVSQLENLRIVYIANEFCAPKHEMQSDCEELARQLVKHHNKPWVTFANSGLNYLTAVFKRNGVNVLYGELSHVIRARSETAA